MSQPILKLAAVYYEEGSEGEPEGLFANVFDRKPNAKNVVTITEYREYPDGKIERRVKQAELRGGAAGRLTPLDANSDFGVRPKEIKYANVVAVWTNILERTDSFPLGLT